jgi:hypothetical protein
MRIFGSGALWADVPYSGYVLGLSDPAHFNALSSSAAIVGRVDGVIAGTSTRHIGDSQSGTDAWYFDRGTGQSVLIGLIGPAYTEGNEVLWATSAGGVFGSARHSSSNDIWYFDSAHGTTAIGLRDMAHQTPAGYQLHLALAVNGSGQLMGVSERYGPGGEQLGPDSWLFNPATGATVAIGLAREGLVQANDPELINSHGSVAGQATLRDAPDAIASRGLSAWYFDSTTGTQRIGLIDAAHMSTNGEQFNEVKILGEDGAIAGTSHRYSGTRAVPGLDAWVFNPTKGTTTQVGFTDALHTASDGSRISQIERMNNTGLAAGTSLAFFGLAEGGRHAWAFDSSSGQLREIGLLDGAHVGTSGRHSSVVSLINDLGEIGGTSSLYSEAVVIGQSAWLYDRRTGTTQAMGLGGTSDITFLTQAGLAAGTSKQGSTQSAWIYSERSGGMFRVGLTDPAHNNDGAPTSTVELASQNGMVVGYSLSKGYDEHSNQVGGRNVWYYDDRTGKTSAIDPTDAAHSRVGQQMATVQFLNEAGQVAGSTFRMGDGSYAKDGWFYDPTSGQTFVFGFSNGPAYLSVTTVTQLTQTGWVLGTFDQYNGSKLLGPHLFTWSMNTGFTDLDSSIHQALAGSAAVYGYSNLLIDENGGVTGYVLDASGRRAFYVAPVPEPGTLGLLAAGGMGVWWSRRRRRR